LISQAVVAAYEKPVSDGIHMGQLTVTGISPCPYGTYINFHKLDPQVTTGQDRIRMKNGHYQEAECIDEIRYAGFKLRFTDKEQITVHVGKSSIDGRPDGLILMDGREDILSIKAVSIDRYTAVRQRGLEAEPLVRCQEQMYLASKELGDRKGTWIYFKHKDSCRPYDIFEPQDLSYSKPIIEALDAIVLGGDEIHRPAEPIPLCVKCRHRATICWTDTVLLDTSGMKTASLKEVTEKWKEGKFYSTLGKSYMEEARVRIIQELGQDTRLLLDDLQVTQIIAHRTDFDTKKFVEKYGAASLVDVQTTKEIPQVRIRQVSDPDA
jgi:hypothetical protein